MVVGDEGQRNIIDAVVFSSESRGRRIHHVIINSGDGFKMKGERMQ